MVISVGGVVALASVMLVDVECRGRRRRGEKVKEGDSNGNSR